ncbi:LtfC-like domain-containing protein [Nocardia asteroides]|uniref:LtfC-like domain-containing protein n=1 Tax=Nocardia asteroides TaxID=1824 RepID=UPI00342775DB
MSDQKQFGYDPTNLTLVLSKGADFAHTVALESGAVFPAETKVRIVLVNASETVLDTWQAVVSSTEAAFVVGSELADVIPAGAKYRMYVSYPTTPTTEYLWFYGAVRRKQ